MATMMGVAGLWAQPAACHALSQLPLIRAEGFGPAQTADDAEGLFKNLLPFPGQKPANVTVSFDLEVQSPVMQNGVHDDRG